MFRMLNMTFRARKRPKIGISIFYFEILCIYGIFLPPPNDTRFFKYFLQTIGTWSNVSDIVFLGYFDVSEHVYGIISLLGHVLDLIWDRRKKSSLPKWCILALLSYYKGNVPKMSKNPDFLRIFQSVFKYHKMILMMFWDVSSVCRVSLRSWNIFWVP